MARIRDNSPDASSDDEQILSDTVNYFKLQKNAEFHIHLDYFQDYDGTLRNRLIHNGSTPSFHQKKQKTFSKYEVIELNFFHLFVICTGLFVFTEFGL